MNREPLQSSSIKSAGYDESRMSVEIEFHTGAIYRYSAVPLEVYVGFMDAESHGRFYVKYIRDNYEFLKLREYI